MKKLNLKWKVVLRRVLLVIFGAVLGINVYMANARNLVGNQIPMPFGYGAAVVLSGSMEPEFSKGDLIIVKETNDVQVNDIVVFQDSTSLVVHRVIEMDGTQLTTKGDSNNTADDPIEITAVKGKVLFWIPYAGTAVNLLKTPIGTICIIAAAIALVEIPRRREKQRDDEERDKIIEEIKRLKEEVKK